MAKTQDGRRSASPSKASSASTSKSAKAKGKERAADPLANIKKPGSQLRAGWKLQPLLLPVTALTADSHSQRSSNGRTASPVKTRTPATRVASTEAKKAATSKLHKASSAIEILSDSDDDIQEIHVASTSNIHLGFKASSTVIEEIDRSRTTPSATAASLRTALAIRVDPLSQDTTELAIIRKRKHASPVTDIPTVFDLDEVDGDLEEDPSFTSTSAFPVTSAALPITFDDEDEILAEVDEDWEDAERMGMRRSNSQASLGGEDYDGSMYDAEDMEDFRAELGEYGEDNGHGDSDDDIRQLMEREDSMEPTRNKRRRQSDASNTSSLRPLSSIRRSNSPAAGLSKITTDTARPNAFTAIMQGNNLDKQWADAAESEKAAARRGFIRPAPFYKILDGMTIAVDAFKYGKIPGVEAYFLSHAHSDHYTNLSSSWSNGPIYCSIGTANLIKYKLQVKDEWIHPLPFDKTFEIAGVNVTVIDANHCPGSSIFVFEGPHTSPKGLYHKTPSRRFRYLHCGDFRASPFHLLHPALKDKKVDICYLDTTYLNPKYCFPAQEQVINACAELVAARVGGDREALMKGSGGGAMLVRQGEMMKGWLNKAKKEEDEDAQKALIASTSNIDCDDKKAIIKHEKPGLPKERLLVVIGTYSIGKERIVKGVARAINAKVYCDQRKREIFACQDDPELMSMVTDDPYAAQIHVTWLGQIKVDLLADYLDQYKPHFSNVIGLRPTGWTFKPEGALATTLKNPSVIQMLGRELQRAYNPSWMTPTKDSTRTVEAYGVPYSEHSSFAELTCFAVSIDCVRFIPTVNVGSARSRSNMATWFEKWAIERKRRRAAGDPWMVPHRTLHYW